MSGGPVHCRLSTGHPHRHPITTALLSHRSASGIRCEYVGEVGGVCVREREREGEIVFT